jgi:hypothetical protein
MKVDYSLTPIEQVNMLKICIKELSQYWSSRAIRLESPMTDGSTPHHEALLIAEELRAAVKELDCILIGQPTIADGFKL